jgi:hypothetical protein
MMSQVKIKRNFRFVSATITTATSTSTTLRMEDMAGAVVEFGTITTNAATLNVWGNNTDTGTFAQLYGSDGAAASITLAPSTTNWTMYALPDASYAVPYVKLVAATTNATANVTVIMKS